MIKDLLVACLLFLIFLGIAVVLNHTVIKKLID
jgi:hypothetical protein